MSMTRMQDQRGFTLIEMIVALMIAAIVAAVLMKSAAHVSDAANFKQTESELEQLSMAIAGNPQVENGGVRADFGYVGDVGALPTSLADLMTNPGGYTTWRGPYIADRFTQAANDCLTDAWGSSYTYQPDSARIISTGSGSSLIRQIAPSRIELLLNRFYGVIYDADGTAPGPTYHDSIAVHLTVPNGAGGTITRAVTPDEGGAFAFDSLPIGNHAMKVIYKPTADTMTRTISMLPGKTEYAEYEFNADYWRPSSASLTMVPESDTLFTSCTKLRFYVRNTTGKSVSISSIRLYYPGTTAYWTKVYWNGVQVVDLGTGITSGDSAAFSSSATLSDGLKAKLEIERFRTGQSSGGWVDMSNVAFTVRFSDGSKLRFTGDLCP